MFVFEFDGFRCHAHDSTKKMWRWEKRMKKKVGKTRPVAWFPGIRILGANLLEYQLETNSWKWLPVWNQCLKLFKSFFFACGSYHHASNPMTILYMVTWPRISSKNICHVWIHWCQYIWLFDMAGRSSLIFDERMWTSPPLRISDSGPWAEDRNSEGIPFQGVKIGVDACRTCVTRLLIPLCFICTVSPPPSSL